MGLRSYKDSIKTAINILWDPKSAFQDLDNKTLEEVIAYYIRMLLLAAIVAGVFNIIFSFLRSTYLELFVNIDINYLIMINYVIGRSSSIIFLFLFVGTFIMFFISFLLKVIFRKIKYTDILKGLMYSLTPMLLFGWIVLIPIPFIIWSLFLFIRWFYKYKNIFCAFVGI